MSNNQTRAPSSKVMISLDDASFACSSYKSGHHIQQLVSPATTTTNNLSRCTFWQSESGTLPHTIYCRLPSIKAIHGVCVFIDGIQDDTYTPQCIAIEAGSYVGDLIEVTAASLEESRQGWLQIDFRETVYASCIAIIIVENVKNGRDSRLRGIQLL